MVKDRIDATNTEEKWTWTTPAAIDGEKYDNERACYLRSNIKVVVIAATPTTSS